MRQSYYPPLIPTGIETRIFEHPALPHPLVLPWHNYNLWLAKVQMTKLYQIEMKRLETVMLTVAQRKALDISNYLDHLTIKKGKKNFQHKFFRFDFVVEVGRKMEAEIFKDFLDWAVQQFYSPN